VQILCVQFSDRAKQREDQPRAHVASQVTPQLDDRAVIVAQVCIWLLGRGVWKGTAVVSVTHTHTHPFNGPFPGLPRWARSRKVKPIWILLKQETVSGSDISWAICKTAPRSRQITTPTPRHSVSCRRDALPATQPTASKHWRILLYQSISQFIVIWQLEGWITQHCGQMTYGRTACQTWCRAKPNVSHVHALLAIGMMKISSVDITKKSNAPWGIEKLILDWSSTAIVLPALNIWPRSVCGLTEIVRKINK